MGDSFLTVFDDPFLLAFVDKTTSLDIRLADHPAGLMINRDKYGDQPVFRQHAAVTQDRIVDINHAGAINQDTAGGNKTATSYPAVGKFEDVPIVEQKDISPGRAHLVGQFGVFMQVAVFAVAGYEVARFNQIVNKL